MKNMFVIMLAARLGFIQGPGVDREKDLKKQSNLTNAIAYLSILILAIFSGWVLANLFANTGIPHRGLDPVLTHSDWALQGKSVLTTVGVVGIFVTIHFAMTCFMYVSTGAKLKTSSSFKSALLILLGLFVALLWVEYGNGIPKYNLYLKNAVDFVSVWLFSSYAISIILELILNRSAKSKQ